MVGLGVTSGIDPLDRHAEVVRRSGRFAAVTVARIASGPAPRELLDGLETPVVHVLPFLMSDGYINRIVLPRALDLDGPVTMRSGAAGVTQLIRCLRPVGVASGMTALLRRRLLEVCRAQGLAPERVDVLVVAHGLSDSNDVTEAEQHAASLMTDFAAASAAFLERPPLIADALRRRGDGVTIVLGIMVASGLHGGNDVPSAIEAARSDGRGPVVWAGNIGEQPAMSQLLLDHLDSEHGAQGGDSDLTGGAGSPHS